MRGLGTNPWSGAHDEGECRLMTKGVRGDLLLFRMQRLHMDEGQLLTLPGFTSIAPTSQDSKVNITHLVYYGQRSWDKAEEAQLPCPLRVGWGCSAHHGR